LEFSLSADDIVELYPITGHDEPPKAALPTGVVAEDVQGKMVPNSQRQPQQDANQRPGKDAKRQRQDVGEDEGVSGARGSGSHRTSTGLHH
jgi:hypothetical protein